MTTPPAVPTVTGIAVVLHLVNRQRRVRLSLSRLKKLATLAFPHCVSCVGGPGAVLATLPAIEITFVSDKTIASIHQQFFQDVSPTDVITFPHGEIIISAETAAIHGRRYGHTLTVEAALYIIHGFLHLNGYTDTTAAEAEKMAKRQKIILETICRNMED